jgi:hypothetical protein
MARASASINIAAPAAEVWRLIGGFGSLSDWAPGISTLSLSEGGRVRHLGTPEGDLVVERLMAFDERRRSYSYHILQSPFPQKDYLSTLRVTEIDGGEGSRVEWFGEFTAIGVSDAAISEIFEKIYQDGLKALKERYRV